MTASPTGENIISSLLSSHLCRLCCVSKIANVKYIFRDTFKLVSMESFKSRSLADIHVLLMSSYKGLMTLSEKQFQQEWPAVSMYLQYIYYLVPGYYWQVTTCGKEHYRNHTSLLTLHCTGRSSQCQWKLNYLTSSLNRVPRNVAPLYILHIYCCRPI